MYKRIKCHLYTYYKFEQYQSLGLSFRVPVSRSNCPAHDSLVKKTMNFKMKFVAIAALSTMLAAPAFAVSDYDYTGNAVAADVNLLAVAEFAAIGAIAGDGNVGFINQEGSVNMASIDQFGATNFAAIQQVGDAALAVVYQIGDSNRANVYQH